MNALVVIEHMMNALIIASMSISKDEWEKKIAANGPTIGEVIEKAIQHGRDYENSQANKDAK